MLQARHIAKYYGAHTALVDINLSVQKGQVVGLLGLNGAGKTTLLRILGGLLPPSAGTLNIAGNNMFEHPEVALMHVGFLPETPPLYPDMTVLEYLTFVAHMKGVRGKQLATALQHALQATDLQAVQKTMIAQLSHGYHRRLGIAQAIVHLPALILLDEPLSGLDPVQIVHMRLLLKKLAEHHTVVLSSHQLPEIHALCDHIVVMHQGSIVAQGSELALLEKVGGHMVVYLEVLGHTDKAQQILGTLTEISHLHIETIDQDMMCITVQLEKDIRMLLAKTLINAGFGLRHMQTEQLKLEGIFLQLTQQTAAQTTPANNT